MHAPETDTEPRYSIGVVCRRTGLKSDRLRAWERRYSVVDPGRSEGNQRLYTDEDIRRLTLLRRLTDAGHRIAHVAGLPESELEELVAADASARVRTPLPSPSAREVGDAARLLSTCLSAVQQLDAVALRARLEEAAGALSGVAFIEELLVPLVHRIGDLWEEGGLKVAHEHLASAVVSAFLENLRVAYDIPEGAPRMIVTTPAGERHELGALVAVSIASAAGWDVTYLGPDLPAEEIAAAGRQVDAGLVGISLVHPREQRPDIVEEIRKLRRHLGEGVGIVVGGRAAPAYQDVVDEIGGAVVEDLAGFRASLAAAR